MKRYRGRKWLSTGDALAIAASALTFLVCCLVLAEMDKEKAVEPQVEVPKKIEIQAIPLPKKVEEPVVEVEPELVSLGEFKITHYCPCSKCCGKWADGITATGTTAEEGRTIAVDPSVIPYGSEVIIRYENGTEGIYTAEDCGGAIKGNKIDVFMDSHQAALIEGVKYGEVFVKEVEA